MSERMFGKNLDRLTDTDLEEDITEVEPTVKNYIRLYYESKSASEINDLLSCEDQIDLEYQVCSLLKHCPNLEPQHFNKILEILANDTLRQPIRKLALKTLIKQHIPTLLESQTQASILHFFITNNQSKAYAEPLVDLTPLIEGFDLDLTPHISTIINLKSPNLYLMRRITEHKLPLEQTKDIVTKLNAVFLELSSSGKLDNPRDQLLLPSHAKIKAVLNQIMINNNYDLPPDLIHEIVNLGLSNQDVLTNLAYNPKLNLDNQVRIIAKSQVDLDHYRNEIVEIINQNPVKYNQPQKLNLNLDLPGWLMTELIENSLSSPAPHLIYLGSGGVEKTVPIVKTVPDIIHISQYMGIQNSELLNSDLLEKIIVVGKQDLTIDWLETIWEKLDQQNILDILKHGSIELIYHLLQKEQLNQPSIKQQVDIIINKLKTINRLELENKTRPVIPIKLPNFAQIYAKALSKEQMNWILLNPVVHKYIDIVELIPYINNEEQIINSLTYANDEIREAIVVNHFSYCLKLLATPRPKYNPNVNVKKENYRTKTHRSHKPIIDELIPSIIKIKAAELNSMHIDQIIESNSDYQAKYIEQLILSPEIHLTQINISNIIKYLIAEDKLNATPITNLGGKLYIRRPGLNYQSNLIALIKNWWLKPRQISVILNDLQTIPYLDHESADIKIHQILETLLETHRNVLSESQIQTIINRFGLYL